MRSVPDWWIQGAWAASGVFATGAVWYFLSAHEYAWAVLCGAAGLACALLAIQLHRTKDALTASPRPQAPGEGDKLVTQRWWESSELRTEYEQRGFSQFYWSNRDSIPERQQQGYEVVFENDTVADMKYRIVNKSGQVLLAKRAR
jgi:hypothetical protein